MSNSLLAHRTCRRQQTLSTPSCSLVICTLQDDSCFFYSYRLSDQSCRRYQTCPNHVDFPGTGSALDSRTFRVHVDNYAGVGSAGMQHCLEWQPVLAPFQSTIDISVNHNSRDAYVCGHHKAMCQSIPEHQTNSDDCATLFTGCQSALRHLHAMMFTHSPETRFDGQVCNNFARKSVRGRSRAPRSFFPFFPPLFLGRPASPRRF